MATLSLSLLGPFTATHNNQPLHNFKNTKAQALLTYLAVERAPVAEAAPGPADSDSR